MHIDEEQIERLRHGELSRTAERSAREHLAECNDCRRRAAEAQQEEAEVHALLGEVDLPAPAVGAGAIAARARAQTQPRGRARDSGRWRWAAGFLVAAGVAGAAYALPGSPVRAWVKTVVERIGNRPEPTPPAPAATPDRRVAGIAVSPGQSLLILFASPQAVGQARVSLGDGAEVVVRAPIGAAAFTSDLDRLVIDNPGSSATFEIEIPRAAPHVEIRVKGARIFLKQGPQVTARESADESGSYSLPLAPP